MRGSGRAVDLPADRSQASRRPAAQATARDDRTRQAAEPGQITITVPERPRRAPNVELRGEMTDSAFKEPPYLIEVEGLGQYIQVPWLLYRIAELADGRRSLEEIAASTSAEVRRDISTDNVRELIFNLMTSGVIELPEKVREAVQQRAVAARSVLALNLKTRVISPEALEPVVRILQYLFWPPVVVVVTVAAFLLQGWLFAVHGVGSSLRDAFYTPGVFAILLGLIVLAAAIHELGHAAALKYGRGKLGGMGVGIYIVYPAFYTDVSSNYRLPKWSRVRTDLGGIYFHLLVALALWATYAVTGSEFLLLAVVLIDYEIVHQLMPFIRLDGYWVLVDISGVPDFFSQMGAFLRSLLPARLAGEGRKLPALKWWGTAFFGTYLLITIPILTFLVFVLIRTTPRIVATGLDAIAQHAASGQNALEAGSYLGAAGYGGQVLLVSLPLFGLGYTLYSLARRAGLWWWRMSSPTWPRRAVGGLGLAAVAAGLFVLWAPRVPVFDDQPGPLRTAWQQYYVPVRPDERLTIMQLAGLGEAPPSTPDAAPGPAATTPTPEATVTGSAPSPTSTAAASPAATASPTATATPRVSPTLTPTVTPIPTGTATPTPTAEPTETPSPASTPGGTLETTQ